jgi:demethoxyubiquinone hydroxylase (CLK1/Coq7/Cat5 family)
VIEAATIIVITAKDISAEDRRRLDGVVERIFQKGESSLDAIAEGIDTTFAEASAASSVMIQNLVPFRSW